MTMGYHLCIQTENPSKWQKTTDFAAIYGSLELATEK